jgi:hypothetical protein
MNDEALLGPWVRRFLLEHVVVERNFTRNTQRSCRDALCQPIPFVAKQSGKRNDRLAVIDTSAEFVRLFLAEAVRLCGVQKPLSRPGGRRHMTIGATLRTQCGAPHLVRENRPSGVVRGRPEMDVPAAIVDWPPPRSSDPGS